MEVTHPIHKYQSIAKQWDEIINESDGGKLRRPITAEECCRMVMVLASMLNLDDLTWVDGDLRSIRNHIACSSNGVNSEDPVKE